MKDSKTIVVAAGGTGGHIYPALAAAKELHEQGYEVIWLGAQTAVEQSILHNVPWRYEKVTASPYRGQGLWGKAWAIGSLLVAVMYTGIQFIRWRPGCVLTTGGYVGLGAGLAAKALGIPLLVSEQNAKAGTVTRLLAPMASAVFTAFPHVFPAVKKEALIESGNPLRQEIAQLAKENSGKPRRNKRKQFVIMVIGGSQGASILNQHLPALLGVLQEKNNVKVYHQCGQGKERAARVEKAYRAQGLACEVLEYYDNIIDYYQQANMIIARAGALSLSEIINLEIPCVTIPLANAIDNHQWENARYYEQRGACWIIEEGDLGNKKKLANLVTILRNSPQKYENMQAACRKVSQYNATERWVATCQRFLKKPL